MSQSAPCKILVAVDFSDTTPKIVEVMHLFHRLCSPHFYLLHVLSKPVVDHLASTSFADREKARQFALRETAPLWEKLEKDLEGISYERVIREGIPHQVIGQTASELECDLLIVGCHLRSRMQELFVGNTAKQILQVTDRPVIFVKA